MTKNLAKHTEKLYYFYEIANYGSLQACARALRVTAPTLSYNLSNLENVLGLQVFDRSNTGVKLTKAGEKLWQFCNRYYRELERVEQSLFNPEAPEVQRIKVGTFQSIAIYFLPVLLSDLSNHPNISVSMSTNRSKIIFESLFRRDIDLALTVETFKQAGLIRHELYDDEYAFYVRRDFSKSVLKKEDIASQSLLYIPEAPDKNRMTLRQHVQKHKLIFKEEFELDSFEVIAEFIVQGFGIGILPVKVVQQMKGKLKQVRIHGFPKKCFGAHRFFLSYREDLDIPQKTLDLFLNSAVRATRAMKF